MTPTNPLVELGHDPGTLFSAHAHQNWVCEPMPEQFSIQEGISCRVLLYLLALLGLHWKYPIGKVTPIGRHPRVPLLQHAYLHGVFSFQ